MTTHEKFKKRKKNQEQAKKGKKRKKKENLVFFSFAPSFYLSSVFYPLFSHSSRAERIHDDIVYR